MKETVTPQFLANIVRMSRSQRKAYLIVEGATDKLVYERFVDSSACFVRVAGDKSLVFETIQILNKDTRNEAMHGAVGVVDGDFDPILGRSVISSVIYTDLHDLECMMLCSPSLGKVLNELGSGEKIAKFTSEVGGSIADVLAKRIMPLGALRLVSLREELPLRFGEPPEPYHETRRRRRSLAFSAFVDDRDLSVDTAKMIKAVLDHSQKHDIPVATLQQKVTDVLTRDLVAWQLVCGHDVVELLCVGLCRCLGSHSRGDVTVELVERYLRLGYEFAYFKMTNLYNELNQWESRNSPFVILAN